MNITAIKTHKITTKDKDILTILDKYLPKVEEKSIIVITSKIISLSQGNVVPIQGTDKDKLIAKEADAYIPREENKYHYTLTIKNNILIPAAGIDKSNTKGNYVLWPKNPQQVANTIRAHLQKKHKRKQIGVIITDSRTTPLRRGTTGIGIAHSGFASMKDYRGKPDVFGESMKITKANMLDALAAAAVAVMGEGKEQTPLAIIYDAPVTFSVKDPATSELKELSIAPEDDVFSELFVHVNWRKKQ